VLFRSENIRVDLSLGGGPLEDIGIYCLNAARYIFKAEPEEVTAFAIRGKDRRFKEVPEAVSATLRFPKDRLRHFCVVLEKQRCPSIKSLARKAF